ncbi:isochorismate synthase [Microbacterium nanhaiense]|uniref:isochorismate synthase n=1 Tax=Microbacterium nanhaiense TaxID=1301026 RepID=A0ABQ2N4J0_9MICO|nr:chorismate-binding protein [Microbacterium nanhaiense]GGO66682.1 isochorismate synthase [Microbacterium nanhaiense]
MTEPLTLPRLVATTREISPVDALEYADPANPLVWTRNGDILVAAGPDLLHIDVGEDGRIAAIADLWRAFSQTADVYDEVELPGTGLVAFAALAFDDASTSPSTLIVPTTVIGIRAGRAWKTRIRLMERPDDIAEPRPVAFGPSWSASLGPGAMDPETHDTAVRRALEIIDSGEAQKIVVARDVVGTVPASADIRRLVRALSEEYADTWTFSVDGIVGASPETLVTVRGGEVSARVLAGTRGRGAHVSDDEIITAELRASEKDRNEHRFAVDSVIDALAPHTSSLEAAEPFALELPNLWHLATDVRGQLDGGASALDLVRALHPTAAVAGTPTPRAVAAIREIEPFDRGRYAGPVGWIDGNGDGEFAIALRCAQFGPVGDAPTRTVAAHAGGGIVAGSVPEAELLETRVKFRPIVDALA